MSSFGEKKEKTFEEKVKERLGEFIRVNNPKYLDDVRSAQLAIESELRQEQERLQKYEEFQTPQKEYEVLDKNILSEVTDRNIKEILPVIDMFFPGTSNMVEDTPKHEIRGVLSITERERVRDELSKKGYEVVLEEKLSEMRKSGKYTTLGAFGHAKYLLECELREEQEILKKEGSDETIRVSSEKRNKLAEIARARLKIRRELEQAKKRIQRKREEEYFFECNR